jgi:hypothetical protein
MLAFSNKSGLLRWRLDAGMLDGDQYNVVPFALSSSLEAAGSRRQLFLLYP